MEQSVGEVLLLSPLSPGGGCAVFPEALDGSSLHAITTPASKLSGSKSLTIF